MWVYPWYKADTMQEMVESTNYPQFLLAMEGPHAPERRPFMLAVFASVLPAILACEWIEEQCDDRPFAKLEAIRQLHAPVGTMRLTYLTLGRNQAQSGERIRCLPWKRMREEV